MFGQRLRHARRAKGLTLADLGAQVGRTPSVLSLIENGKREPRLSLVEQLAAALGVPVSELLKKQPPSRRAQLEITLEQAQRDPSYAALGLPELRVGTRVPTDVLEHLVALSGELRAQRAKPTATPEEARAANAALRGFQRERDNYFAGIEQAAADALTRADYAGGALSQGMLLSVVAQLRLLRPVRARPAALGPVADRPARPPDLPQAGAGRRPLAAGGDPAGARPLPARPRHAAGLRRLPAPAGRGELLRGGGAHPRAGRGAVPARREGPPRPGGRGPGRRLLGVLRDGRAPGHQPHHPPPRRALPLRQERRERHHLQGLPERRRGVPGRQHRRDRGAADVPPVVGPPGVRGRGPLLAELPVLRHAVRHLFLRRPGRPERRPSPATRSPSGCRSTTPAGSAAASRPSAPGPAVPDGDCCQRAPAALAERWEGMAWPSARAHSHVLSVLPSGAFPGVDDVDIYEFLDRHSGE